MHAFALRMGKECMLAVAISHRSQSFFQLGTESSEILIVKVSVGIVQLCGTMANTRCCKGVRRTVAAGIVFLLKSC